jgi:hypothetical protein
MARWSEAKVSNRPRGIQFDLKTTISSDAVGRMTSGVLPIERMPGITEEARQQLTIRALLASSPTTFQVIDFVKVQSPMSIASPVPEASTKPENQVTLPADKRRLFSGKFDPIG